MSECRVDPDGPIQLVCVIDRIRASKQVHILISRLSECVTSQKEEGLCRCDQVKVLEMGKIILNYPGGPNVTTSILLRGL